MKAMILVLSPKECMNLLNGDLSVLARKKFPKDYVGWVYIYCTKDDKQELCYIPATETFYCYSKDNIVAKQCGRMGLTFNSKVVARFWCDKVEEILLKENGNFYTNSLSNRKLLTQSCLTQSELNDYMAGNWKQKFGYWYGGYAIHITKVEPFDKPKEIKEFYKVGYEKCVEPQGSLREQVIENYNNALKYQLTCAPRSGWCYVEV